MKRTTLILSLSLLVVIIAAIVMNSTDLVDAQEQPPPTPSAYVDLLETEIRGLSPEQIETYRTGGGGGMALPAELNGYPGPRHVLDLVDDLELTDDQRSQIQALYDEMLPEAIDLGNQILAAEAELELAFRERNIDEAILENQLLAIGELQAQLRFVHLRTHLATIDVLTQHQVVVYNSLRGYDIENPHRHGGH
jgi:Spy/CpxP family protein refolding chaperone